LVACENNQMRAEYNYDYTDHRITKLVAPRRSLSGSTKGGRDGMAFTSVLYTGRHFEVREHEQPTKFVFNGPTRVARLIGSLSGTRRIQRIRVYSGWNLLSLWVAATNALAQLQAVPASDPSCWKWNGAAAGWLPVAMSETLPAGTVLWLRSTIDSSISIIGA